MRLMSRHVFGSLTTVALALSMLAVMADGAEARLLKCTSTGTFFAPVLNAPPTTADVVVAALGNCNVLSGVTFAGTTTVGTVPDTGGCVAVSSNGVSTVFNKNGDSFEYTFTGSQCFKDADGDVPTTSGFCGPATDTYGSVIGGTFTITGGTGNKAGATGAGTFSSVVNHCNPGFPFGNSATSSFKGQFQLP